MKVTGNACSHTPASHNLKLGVDSRCEACQHPAGVRGSLGKHRTWREGNTKKFPSDATVRLTK